MTAERSMPTTVQPIREVDRVLAGATSDVDDPFVTFDLEVGPQPRFLVDEERIGAQAIETDHQPLGKSRVVDVRPTGRDFVHDRRYARVQADFTPEPVTLPSALSLRRCACTWLPAMSFRPSGVSA